MEPLRAYGYRDAFRRTRLVFLHRRCGSTLVPLSQNKGVFASDMFGVLGTVQP